MKEYNHGNKAGKKSRSYNLGTEDKPVQITKNTLLDLLADMEGVAYEDTDFGELIEDNKYYLISKSITTRGKEIEVMAVINIDKYLREF